MEHEWLRTCPMCGYPLQRRFKKALGLSLWLCTNEPELCGFMTNEYAAGKLPILRCDRCRDGYLIVKPGRQREDGTREDYFLGCTNYRKDGRGCNRTMTRQNAYARLNIRDDRPAEAVVFRRGLRNSQAKNTDNTTG